MQTGRGGPSPLSAQAPTVITFSTVSRARSKAERSRSAQPKPHPLQLLNQLFASMQV